MSPGVTLALGGREFALPPLQLRHLGEIARLIDEPAPSTAALVERSVEILAVALRHADPSLTEDNIRALAGSWPELNEAVARIMEAAGFRAAGEAAPAPEPSGES